MVVLHVRVRREHSFCHVVALGFQVLAMSAILSSFGFVLALIDPGLLLGRRDIAEGSARDGFRVGV
jgi:hypothetical protein